MSEKRREQAEALLARVYAENAVLGQLLELLIGNIDYLIDTQESASAASVASPTTPTGFGFSLNKTNVLLSWDAQADASLYEVRKGTVWDTGTFITKVATISIALDPLTVGSHDYMLKAINSAGVYSDNFASVVVNIPVLGQPVLTPIVIDNNVNLYWTEPASAFRIDHYKVWRGATLLGTKNGTFTTILEVVGGTYTYKVAAVDIAGNEGPQGVVNAEVRQPPDYELENDFTSALDGTKTNVLLEAGKLVCCVDLTETFAAHFTSNAWNHPQDQIDAGYPIYIQPTLNTGSYQEEKDYGTVISNVIVNVAWAEEHLSGNTTIAVQMEVKDAAMDPWSTPTSGANQYFASLRYLRITLNFTQTADTDLLLLSNLRITLDVKIEMDGGTVSALAADSGGTTVTFNKSFRDVRALTATAQNATEPIDVVRDFVDVPNPTTFKVLAFDFAGQRIDATVSWKARGVV